jgi:outer membrane protein insertion porin family
LSQLGYFDPQAISVLPIPNPAAGTVDIEYTVSEKANDQIELSGGWGGNNRANNAMLGQAYGYGGLVGTLGLSLNNFSTRKLLKPSMWNPLPSGDGQKLSLRYQSNGRFFSSFNFTFTEPWLGGKKRNSFSINVFNTKFSNAYNPLTGLFDRRYADSSYLTTSGAYFKPFEAIKSSIDHICFLENISIS